MYNLCAITNSIIIMVESTHPKVGHETMNMMMVSEKSLLAHLKEAEGAKDEPKIPSSMLPVASSIVAEEDEIKYFKHACSNPKENMRL